MDAAGIPARPRSAPTEPSATKEPGTPHVSLPSQRSRALKVDEPRVPIRNPRERSAAGGMADAHVTDCELGTKNDATRSVSGRGGKKPAGLRAAGTA